MDLLIQGVSPHGCIGIRVKLNLVSVPHHIPWPMNALHLANNLEKRFLLESLSCHTRQLIQDCCEICGTVLILHCEDSVTAYRFMSDVTTPLSKDLGEFSNFSHSIERIRYQWGDGPDEFWQLPLNLNPHRLP